MRPPYRVSHVVFDIDGTLVDFAASFRAGADAVAEELSRLTGRAVSGRDVWEAQRAAGTALDQRAGGMGMFRPAALREALTSLGCDESQVASLIDIYGEARESLLQPYDDSEETVAALHERGFVLVAASNGNAEMARLPLFRYFDATWFARETGVSKPDPRFFLGALEHAGARPESAVMVGDRLDNDYEPALLAGMHAVLIDRERKVEDASVVRIGALTELLGLLERAA